ncbi:MAG: thiol oxidoreductase [Halobacteriovoraceae bacterium]|nr:thiol oxidoreductase [Halobacteriovoraceae bacterium]
MSKVTFSPFLIFLLCIGITSHSLQAKVLSGRFVKNFAQLRDDLTKSELAKVKAGHSLFSKPWVQPPSSTFLRNGLGPHFNAVSCMSCHPGFGRGAPPHVVHPKDPALLFKVRSINKNQESSYGDQIQPMAIIGITPEAAVQIEYTQTFNGKLIKPHYQLKDYQFGPLKSNEYLSPRIAPHLAGLGLLNRIKEEDILENQRNGGKARLIKGRVGRFGWKADRIDLRHQVAAAFQGDLGITNPLFSNQPCTEEQIDCLNSPNGIEEEHQFEISEKHMGFVVDLMDAIDAPKRQIDPDKISFIEKGSTLFQKINCQSCHRESYQLDDRVISPYTDLLLHDMGEGLASERSDRDSYMWKTPPLWGLGSQKKVNSHTRLLHDGRARNIEEAILWHGGEATMSREAYLKLSKTEKAELHYFLESL